MGNRGKNGGPERSVSRGFDGNIAAKKFDEKELPEMGARRAQQPSQHQKRKGEPSLTKANKQSASKAHLHYLCDDDVLSSHSSKHHGYGSP